MLAANREVVVAQQRSSSAHTRGTSRQVPTSLPLIAVSFASFSQDHPQSAPPSTINRAAARKHSAQKSKSSLQSSQTGCTVRRALRSHIRTPIPASLNFRRSCCTFSVKMSVCFVPYMPQAIAMWPSQNSSQSSSQAPQRSLPSCRASSSAFTFPASSSRVAPVEPPSPLFLQQSGQTLPSPTHQHLQGFSNTSPTTGNTATTVSNARVPGTAQLMLRLSES